MNIVRNQDNNQPIVLREYQKESIKNTVNALKCKNNTLLIAPTGAGKTVMLSHVINDVIDSQKQNSYVLVHRKEVNEQNYREYSKLFPTAKFSTFNAHSKELLKNGVTFCMMQSLFKYIKRNKYVDAPDLLVIDEVHRARCSTYTAIIDYFRKRNPKLKLFGVTATPERIDGLGLGKFFTNISKEIRLGELIESGALVKPIAKIVDDESLDAYLKADDDCNIVKATIGDEDVGGNVLTACDGTILKYWQDENSVTPRKTIVFARKIVHAIRLTRLFNDAGIKSNYIHGGTKKKDREKILKDYNDGVYQVLFNVNIFTEGFNSPETSCIMLLRRCSGKSIMIQMVGRGLRLAPNKEDCLIIDFGKSLKTHKDLFAGSNLEDRKRRAAAEEEAKEKERRRKAIYEVSEFDLKVMDVLGDMKNSDASDIWVKVPTYGGFYVAAGFNTLVIAEIQQDKNRGFLWIWSNDNGYQCLRHDLDFDIGRLFENGYEFIIGNEDVGFNYLCRSMKAKAVTSNQKRVLDKRYKEFIKNRYEAMCIINMQKRGDEIYKLRRQINN